MSNDAAGFTRVTDRPVAPPYRAFDTGLRPDPFPDRAASLLPGLLTATRTGLTPASDDEHEQQDHPATSRGHLPAPLGALEIGAKTLATPGKGRTSMCAP